MPHLNQIMFNILLICLLTTLPMARVLALPDDQHQTLELSADTIDLNQQNQHGEYQGHVELDQGTTHLRAAKAITHTDKHNQLIAAFAYGDPTLPLTHPSHLVHYWTKTDLEKPILHAWAEIIRYFPHRHRIELIGHASVKQGNDSLVAPKICYDTLEQHVLTEHHGKTRTVIIFHPEKQT